MKACAEPPLGPQLADPPASQPRARQPVQEANQPIPNRCVSCPRRHTHFLCAAAPPAVPVALEGIAGRGVPTTQGRLLAYTEGVWGPVASWYANNYGGTLAAMAAMACGQLGYANGVAVSPSAYAPNGDSGQHYIACAPGAASLADCSSSGLVNSGYDQVDVACSAAGGEGGGRGWVGGGSGGAWAEWDHRWLVRGSWWSGGAGGAKAAA